MSIEINSPLSTLYFQIIVQKYNKLQKNSIKFCL
jgi:hypothetical protein